MSGRVSDLSDGALTVTGPWSTSWVRQEEYDEASPEIRGSALHLKEDQPSGGSARRGHVFDLAVDADVA